MTSDAFSRYPSIEKIEILNGGGPWQTKSGGQLDVLFQLPIDFIQQQYFNYEEERLRELPIDIRGLRAYSVQKINKGSKGAGEWHKLRSELVFAIDGSAKWTCEDIHGSKETVILSNGAGVYTPPGIMHTYTALEDDTRLLVISNTLFDATNPSTQDSYTIESFQQLQAQCREGNG